MFSLHFGMHSQIHVESICSIHNSLVQSKHAFYSVHCIKVGTGKNAGSNLVMCRYPFQKGVVILLVASHYITRLSPGCLGPPF